MNKKALIIAIVIVLVIIAVVSGMLSYSYSSIWGSSKGPLASNRSENKLSCPDLPQAVLYGRDTATDGSDIWVASKVDYHTPTRELVYSPDISYGGDIIEKFSLDPEKVYLCDLGSRHIELGEDENKYNPDYVYCGDFIRPITLYEVDEKGNTIDSTKTSVEIIFDSKTKKYISTRCGGYDVIILPS